MSILGKILEKKESSKSVLEAVQEVGGKLIVDGYRKIAEHQDFAPTNETSDQEILEIYTKVGSAFREASKQRDETITAGKLNMIVFHFLQIKEANGDAFVIEHLEYEIEKYIESGLRESYQKELDLF